MKDFINKTKAYEPTWYVEEWLDWDDPTEYHLGWGIPSGESEWYNCYDSLDAALEEFADCTDIYNLPIVNSIKSAFDFLRKKHPDSFLHLVYRQNDDSDEDAPMYVPVRKE